MNLGRALFRCVPSILRPHTTALPTQDYSSAFNTRTVFGRWWSSGPAARKCRGVFDDVRYYVFFVGWPRSGHSIFGSLLDAHPAFLVAHELDALPLIDAGFSRHRLFTCILQNSKGFAEAEGGRSWTGYSYSVPNQFQGRFKDLHVVGDKKGGASTFYLSFVNPTVIDKLRKRVKVPIKVILYHRNPFDMMATEVRRTNMDAVHVAMVDLFFDQLVPTVDRLRRELDPQECVELHHDDFLADPKVVLRKVIEAFEEKATSSFLEDATSMLHKSSHKSRNKISWNPDIVKLVEENMAGYEWLRRYSFES